ncbi:MAG: hypothetical protein PHC88_13160 [Terrimicrobiaceae bacterium]|nr:hypothetical protein [Terrimicrobiaceae bacterium]
MSKSTESSAPGGGPRAGLAQEPGFRQRTDAWLRAWGPLVLLVFAIVYYGQYYRSGLNPGGEGGTVAVIAMRLNEGWLPIKDTFLGYNVMWFYPVAWLFRLTGPDYIALRIYFFVLCALSGLLGFLIVRRVTGHGWYALGVGLLILTIPGMLFRNYMGLLPLLNAWALLHAFVFAAPSARWQWVRFAVAGLALGVTYLVRVDVGIFFTAIYIGLAALYPLGVRGRFLRRLPVAVGGAAVCALAAIAIQAPFFIDAQRRGFGPEFAGQYLGMWGKIKYEAAGKFSRPQASRTTANGSWTPVRFKKFEKNSTHTGQAKRDEGTRPRPALRDVFKQASFSDAAFILILHLPILVSVLLMVVAGGALAWALAARNPTLKESALVSLVTLGSALTLFPQYFFFRPDTPHLSEFMIPFLVAMACASFFALRRMAATRSWFVRVACLGFVVLCATDAALYFLQSFPKESAGTIAASRKRSYELVADNGVRVLVKHGERPWMQALHDTVVRFSAPDEWVVALPYSPTINFMTNRRSYLENLYVDNATAPRDFLRRTVSGIERFRPAVIVIDQRAINNTEFSRFRNWAAPAYDYIRSHYTRIPGDFDSNEIYVRPDKIAPQA